MTVTDVGLSRLVESSRGNLSPNMRERLFGLSILCLDPGYTTGWAAFEGLQLRLSDHEEWLCGEESTPTIKESVPIIQRLISSLRPDVIVVENYKIYPWHANDHKWSEVYVPRLIGCMETFHTLYGIPLVKQMAGDAKGFCSDEKLKAWGMYIKGKPHARDAIRHGCYFLLFNKEIDRILV